MIQRLLRSFGGKIPRGVEEVSPENIPKHVAIIMDGNGRWAKKRGLPRVAGHRFGMNTVKKITIAANDLGVKILTLYAFSTENWKRPKAEVDLLMKLPQEFLSLELDELIEKNVQVRMMGWKENLPDFTRNAVEEAVKKTKNNTGLILNFAFNYGSRKEMLTGMQQMLQDIQTGVLSIEQITESVYSNYLQSSLLPDPDLLIRTSGEMRISNFMLWQLAYTEMWFTDVHWPAFEEKHFYEAIKEYQRRIRRYGGL